MQVNGVAELPAYLRLPRSARRARPAALLQDLLISVTNFFRDRDAFDALEAQIAGAVRRASGRATQVRVWVAGCATGEEAYSVAMLLREHARGIEAAADDPDLRHRPRRATRSRIARDGLLPANDRGRRVGGAAAPLLHPGAGPATGSRKELREMVLFAVHNLLQDPPFSRLDLVTLPQPADLP